jgi:PilZ domain-containing protein
MKAVRCTVADISQGGACLVADSEFDESDFYLEVDTDPGRRTVCTVVWRRGSKMGVKFA